MKARISQKDWERISAYLDGQLDDKAAEKVKRDLDARPDLRKAFGELQRYKVILQQVPMRRARRNFTLQPGMLKVQPLPRLVPVFRLTSAVVAILAVILFAIDLVPSLSGLTLAAPKAAAPASESLESSAAPQIIYWNGQENYVSPSGVTAPAGMGGGGGGYGGGGGEAPSVANVQPTEAPVMPLTATPSPALLEAIAPLPEKGVPPISATPEPTPTLDPNTVATDTAMDQVIQSGAESPILGIRPTEEQGKIIPGPSEGMREAAAIQQPSRILTFIAGELLLLAAAGGILSWVLAKKRKA